MEVMQEDVCERRAKTRSVMDILGELVKSTLETPTFAVQNQHVMEEKWRPNSDLLSRKKLRRRLALCFRK